MTNFNPIVDVRPLVSIDYAVWREKDLVIWFGGAAGPWFEVGPKTNVGVSAPGIFTPAATPDAEVCERFLYAAKVGTRRRQLIAASLAAGLMACSLLVNLDSLHQGDAAGVDGSTDGPGGDGGVHVSPCFDAGKVIVCDDFDEDPIGLRWSSVVQAYSSIAIDDAASVSPPNSLLVTMPPDLDAALRQSMLTKSFTAPSVDCTFSLRIDQTTATGTEEMRVWQLTMTLPDFISFNVWMEVDPLNFSFIESLHPKPDGGDGGGQTVSTVLPFSGYVTGTWYRVHLFTDFAKVQVDIDGINKLDAPLIAPGSPGGGPGTIQLGQTYDTDLPQWLFRIDDVLCK